MRAYGPSELKGGGHFNQSDDSLMAITRGSSHLTFLCHLIR